MTLFQAILLGLVQGLTEFLPVSSSGHLVLLPALLGWDIPPEQAFVFDVIVQVGTLLAVIVYFRGDLLRIARRMLAGIADRAPFADPDARLGWRIVLSTLPAGLAGLMFKDAIEAAFASPVATAVFLLFTAGLLLVAEMQRGGDRSSEDLSGWDALVIGFYQILALFPGVSRSGSTITGGMTRGLRRDEAARFSFLMAVPIMLAAGALSLLDLRALEDAGSFLPMLAAGFAAAAVTGYLAIRWFIAYLKRGSLYGFAVYVILLAVLTLFVLR